MTTEAIETPKAKASSKDEISESIPPANGVDRATTHKSHHGGFRAMEKEYSYWCEDIEGKVPNDLQGTFFRNGPGRIKIGNDYFGHWFDGDGMVSAISFKDGNVHYKNRYVRTPKYLKETAKQRVDCRGFGTMRHGGTLGNLLRAPANPANTNIMYHGGKLLAFYEGGRPFELDPGSLDTLGEYFYEGRLGIQNTFSAHGKTHPKTGYFYNFGIGASGVGRKGLKSKVDFYKVSPNGHIVNKVALPVKGSLPFLHDFAITEHYAVIVVSSIVMTGMFKCALGLQSIADSTVFDNNQPAQVLVVDLESMQEVERFEIEPMGVIHFGNGWEEKGDLIFELISFSDFAGFDALKNISAAPKVEGAEFVRFVINRSKASIGYEQIAMDKTEFPTWNTHFTGLKNNYTYSVATLDNGTGSYFNSILKREHTSDNVICHDFGAGRFTSEAIYIPSTESKEEDDGYVSSVVYDADQDKSEIVILKAKDLSDVARVKLDHHIPHGFHGSFTPELFLH